MESEKNMKSIIKSSVHRAEAQHRTTRCILIAAAIMALGSRVGWSAPYFYAIARTGGVSDLHSGTTSADAGAVFGVPVTGGLMSGSASAHAGTGTCWAFASATLSATAEDNWGGCTFQGQTPTT